ncbi:hypothetical protein EJ05DRAFT_500081 [Pseudovirgaria hyperparasitica]|uniref:BZIP domain-containing protein n=1 Tax=Pseudovirgaria hyperparasitica TaxID=470096 RepID=A0A6A6W7F6_9PEZI|nr:uncharacterized protein EJ05DRAFT_500081 [Pseudovirgaria hyperparasitica]KAF2758563.1 hypothetical protein EJ05DRAFT_500081 [Pseudovirgaria hyperparasitica]
MSSINKTPSHEGYSSADSESKKQAGLQTPQGRKRRPSRAGTRSVTTLTAAQLERKRANDREAQRAIRQRTKDHIESLERRISELTSTDVNARLMSTLERNTALESENEQLRSRLHQALNSLHSMEGSDTPGSSLSTSDRLGLMQAPRPSSTPTARSLPSLPVSQGEWSQHSSYTSAPTSSPMESGPPTGHHGQAGGGHWSPHSSTSVTQSLPSVPEAAYPQPQIGYYEPEHAARSVSYSSEGTQGQHSLPYGNGPPQQQSHTTAQGPASQPTYGYTSHPHGGQQSVPEYSQQRALSSQAPSYPHYGHQQTYMGQTAPHAAPGAVQHGGEGLQMMHQQAAAQPQGGHMMYNMKVEQ